MHRTWRGNCGGAQHLCVEITSSSLVATADRGIVDSASRLRLLLESGLGDCTETHRDWRTARSAACALQRVGENDNNPNSARTIILEKITERLCSVIRGDWRVDARKEDTM
mmetsp:Transcript_47874/g.71293  ORF Transcript_47874/g.71293 Transcript_47874/m.71293 type:complete len:111 (-) Transcript_47874:137-469(-)